MSEIVTIVIENGSTATRAGFSSSSLPALVIPSLYSQNANGDIVVGDEIADYPDNEIFTILKDGVVYNWDALEKLWGYIFEKLNVNPDEYPLTIIEPTWNSKKNRAKLAELAFNTFSVPLLNIFKAPIATSYGLGKSTSLIIDIGASSVSVTPVVDGQIINKGTIHSKFAGDFINLHVLNYLSSKFNVDSLFSETGGSESFKRFRTTDLINDFKTSILNISNFPIVNSAADFNVVDKPYQFLNGEIIEVGKEQLLLAEPLFHPLQYPLPGVELPQDSTLGLIDLILLSLKKSEANKEVYDKLLTNIVLTGGSSLLPGLETRLLNDLSRFLPKFVIQSFTNPSAIERVNSNWIGAGILDSMNSFEEAIVTKVEFEEKGEEIINEKFK
jgi:actin-related protein